MSDTYEIVVAGEAGPLLEAAMEGFDASARPPGCSRFVGEVADPTMLQETLHRLNDLHVELLEVRRLDP